MEEAALRAAHARARGAAAAKFERERFGSEVGPLREALGAAIDREFRCAPRARACVSARASAPPGWPQAGRRARKPAATCTPALLPTAARPRSARATANSQASSAACERAEMACEEVLDREARQGLPSSGRFTARYQRCSAAFEAACVGPALALNKGATAGPREWQGWHDSMPLCPALCATSSPLPLHLSTCPPVPPASCPAPCPAERLTRAWVRESARFKRDYNDRLLNGLVFVRWAGWQAKWVAGWAGWTVVWRVRCAAPAPACAACKGVGPNRRTRGLPGVRRG